MRISDWSSDVCSSDLENNTLAGGLILALALPLIIPNEFLIHVMIMVFFYGILASSLNLTVGYVGELPLGHAAFLGIGAYKLAILSVQFHVPFWLALPVDRKSTRLNSSH